MFAIYSRWAATPLLLVFIIWVGTAFTANAQEDACTLSTDEEQTLLELDFQAFDQGMEPLSGWRKLRADECYLAGAALIDSYLALHEDKLTKGNISLLNWHAGQQSANAGHTDRALNYFRKTFRPEDDPASWLDWNSYVAGSIAFLEGDHAELVAARDRLRLQDIFSEELLRSLPKETAEFMRGKKPNLDVLEAFLNCFDRPYVVAYGSDCRATASE